MKASAVSRVIEEHINELRGCKRCPAMVGPVVAGRPVASRVYLCGQAPGAREGEAGKPFAWTAGKTLFKWFSQIGLDEEQFRSLVYMAAVCRCFPGKTGSGGDRVPSAEEIANCSSWMQREIEILQPHLVIAVGRLAIERFLPPAPLAELVGRQFRVLLFRCEMDVIPLPHPSGASTWFRREPGQTLLSQALGLINSHPAWVGLRRGS